MNTRGADTRKVDLRRAAPSDAERLRAWANSPDSLANKRLTTGPVTRAEHELWLGRRLADPATLLFIVEDRGTPVGQVRLQRRDDAYEADIYVAPPARRQGLASDAVVQAMEALRQARPGAVVRAWVREGNTPSRCLFERLGFARVGAAEGFTVFEHRPPKTRGSHER